MRKKGSKYKRIPIIGKENKDTDIKTFRNIWEKKGYDLVDITSLCSFELGESGWCSDINEPDENIYHIKIKYRNEEIATFPFSKETICEGYVIFVTNKDDITGADFIIFKKCKI